MIESSASTRRLDPEVARTLKRAVDGQEISWREAVPLLMCSGVDLLALQQVADELRFRQCGDNVTYVVNRNINFTNACIKHCTFCAFSRSHREEEAYSLPMEEILRRVREAVEMGATEVCLQAGLAPKLPGTYYIELCRAIKRECPNVHIHAFSPEEVLYGATRMGISIRDTLEALKEAGLGTLPGTSAEILDQEMRDLISPGRITRKQWIEVITSAHALGIRTTSTIMYGHVETVEHQARHLDLLRSLQKETRGFTEFVPLSFVHQEAPMYRKRLVEGVRQGPTGAQVVRMHAVARLMLGDTFRNIQASWVKEGPRLAQWLLTAGCNDLGGTLINESISTSAGAAHGQLLPPHELRRLIRDLGRTPVQRNTTYGTVQTFEDEDVDSPLDAVEDADSRFGSYQQLASSGQYRFKHPSQL